MRALVLLLALVALAAEERAILVALDAAAPDAVRAAAERLVADPPSLFAVLQQTQGAGTPVLVDAAELMAGKQGHQRAAFNHLVVIGLPGEPLVDRVWGQVQAVDRTRPSVYQQGYGELLGSVGIVEADRNPFLHSQEIRGSGFETVVLRLSGSDEAGLLAAVQALRAGVINALVPAAGWRRGEPTILDLDPPTAPPALPPRIDQARLAGWTQCDASEYRALLAAAGHDPQAVWRAKYLVPGVFDQLGGAAWKAGLHRKAWGHAVTLARFADSAAAAATAAALAEEQGVARDGEWWHLPQDTDSVFRQPGGDIRLRAVGATLVLHALGAQADAAITAALR